MKKSRKTLLLLSLITALGCFGQSKAVFTPKTGKLIFKREINITDQKLVDSTFLNGSNKVLDAETKWFNKIMGIYKTDSTHSFSSQDSITRKAMDNFFNPNIMNSEVFLQGFEFKDSIIEVVVEKDNIKPIYRSTIKRKKGLKLLEKIDENDHRAKFSTYQDKYKYSPENNLVIEEYRDQTKIINGYNCFKIIVQQTQSFGRSKNVIVHYKYTMYGTKELQDKYHPIINFKSLLTKYYPLEIIITNDLVKGYEKVFSLKEVDLK
ncbi:hypothetical protein [Aquimarina algiphila]|uniref:DUF4292 domain-containing protein n=1 Tax=Aquimarina algiphila TaxID=2047982 RepID=A0A554VD79_9FLAO|nr:hypothetical protein [Aquimarina algiphila]TSE04799.1 hypothetical protein FOF46_25175 [Aquimarina algiphila]